MLQSRQIDIKKEEDYKVISIKIVSSYRGWMSCIILAESFEDGRQGFLSFPIFKMGDIDEDMQISQSHKVQLHSVVHSISQRLGLDSLSDIERGEALTSKDNPAEGCLLRLPEDAEHAMQ